MKQYWEEIKTDDHCPICGNFLYFLIEKREDDIEYIIAEKCIKDTYYYRYRGIGVGIK